MSLCQSWVCLTKLRIGRVVVETLEEEVKEMMVLQSQTSSTSPNSLQRKSFNALLLQPSQFSARTRTARPCSSMVLRVMRTKCFEMDLQVVSRSCRAKRKRCLAILMRFVSTTFHRTLHNSPSFLQILHHHLPIRHHHLFLCFLLDLLPPPGRVFEF